MQNPKYYQNKTSGKTVKLLLIADDYSAVPTAVYSHIDGPRAGQIFSDRLFSFNQKHYQLDNMELDLPCDLCGRLKNGKRPPQPVFKPKRF